LFVARTSPDPAQGPSIAAKALPARAASGLTRNRIRPGPSRRAPFARIGHQGFGTGLGGRGLRGARPVVTRPRQRLSPRRSQLRAVRDRAEVSREARRAEAQNQPRARPNRVRGGLRSSLRSLRSFAGNRGGLAGLASPRPPPGPASHPPPLRAKLHRRRSIPGFARWPRPAALCAFGARRRCNLARPPPRRRPRCRVAFGGGRRRVGGMPALSSSFSALLSPALSAALRLRTWLVLGRAAPSFRTDLGADADRFGPLSARTLALARTGHNRRRPAETPPPQARTKPLLPDLGQEPRSARSRSGMRAGRARCCSRWERFRGDRWPLSCILAVSGRETRPRPFTGVRWPLDC